MQTTTLFGVPHSLYAGRARSYLIKAGIPYRELAPKTDHFLSKVLPLAGGRFSMPTLELPDGRVVRDGAAIIDHFEEESDHTFSPRSPRQSIVSRLFDVIGAEGLLRPAMHYRWNFEDENLDFLVFHMELMTPPGETGTEMAWKIVNSMRKAAVNFGVVPETFEFTEALYAEQLAAMDRHFEAHPYLLGGRPCIGDFGLIAPMYGHLGRDPKPLSMMHQTARFAMRWVERMNRPGTELVGFDGHDATYLADDEIPETLIDLLRVLAVDFVPETQAAADTINAWLADQDELAPGTTCARGLGHGEFDVRGTKISALAQPYRFYLLKRVQDAYAALNPQDQDAVKTLLAACDMAPVLDITLTRDIGRQNNLEVWV